MRYKIPFLNLFIVALSGCGIGQEPDGNTNVAMSNLENHSTPTTPPQSSPPLIDFEDTLHYGSIPAEYPSTQIDGCWLAATEHSFAIVRVASVESVNSCDASKLGYKSFSRIHLDGNLFVAGEPYDSLDELVFRHGGPPAPGSLYLVRFFTHTFEGVGDHTVTMRIPVSTTGVFLEEVEGQVELDEEILLPDNLRELEQEIINKSQETRCTKNPIKSNKIKGFPLPPDAGDLCTPPMIEEDDGMP